MAIIIKHSPKLKKKREKIKKKEEKLRKKKIKIQQNSPKEVARAVVKNFSKRIKCKKCGTVFSLEDYLLIRMYTADKKYSLMTRCCICDFIICKSIPARYAPYMKSFVFDMDVEEMEIWEKKQRGAKND